MLSHCLKLAAYRYIAFNSLMYKYQQLSYFSFDFDRDCGRLHGIIKACISQGSHRLEKYLNIQDCLEKSLKIKFAVKSI